MGSGHRLLLGQKQAITHSCHTKHHPPFVPWYCSVPSPCQIAAFWFDQPRPTRRDVRKEEELSGHTRCRLSRDRHPERSLSRGRNLLAFGSAVPAAHHPGTGAARSLRDQSIASTGKLSMPKGLAAAPKDSTLRMDGPTHPRSCRHIPVPSVRASHSFNCPVVLGLFMARLLLSHQTSRVYGETSYAGRTGPSFAELHVQNGPSSPSKKLQPTPGVQSASPSARAPVPRCVESTGPMSDGAHGVVQDAQTVSATQNQNAATWKGSNLRPCSSTA